MSTSYSGGTNFSWPVKGETNWDTIVDAALAILSAHNHQGGGLGGQLTAASYASDSVTGAKIRLANNEALRARNTANGADIDILRVGNHSGSLNITEFRNIRADTDAETLVASGAISVAKTITFITAGTAFTLGNQAASGAPGQVKIVVSLLTSTIATVTPSTTTDLYNTVALMPGGVAVYRSTSSATWTLSSVRHGTVTNDVVTLTSVASPLAAVTREVILNVAGGTLTLNDGVAGQELYVVNINATTTNVVPATTAGINSAALSQYGSVLYKFLGGEWRAFAGAGCVLS